ncbi:hypothetical protein Vadar_001935 [Vaccinium darrowii]|uniref:Uncharacterized protein n=1 Tax=Vaccinium darrowii TaxID=229202 RepID=A0ACB7XWH5_9ERIC|nr:hypothetical protein Vadar_001935 [Vaccinium darrowii]
MVKAVEVANEVNQWAEKETNGLIKEVLPSGSVDASTRLIFANALYFKGAWTEKFDASKTKDQDFHLLNGSSVQVPFMTSKKKQLVSAFDGFKVLGLPYKQGEDKRRFSMYFFLPKAKDGLSSLMEKVSSESGFLDRHLSNQTDVSFSLAKQVSLSESKNSNLVFSPLSIHVVLGLIAAGSKGPTQTQLLSFLNSNSIDDLNSLSSHLVSLVFADGGPSGGPRLSFANGVWVDRSLSLKPSFKQVVDTVYKAASSHVDFENKAVEVVNEVNQWAEKETNGLIKEVLPSGSVDASTRLIFANAVYFKGVWNEKFDASKTKDQDFHLLNGSSVQVPFMTSKKKQLVSAFDSFKVLGRPYKQGESKRRFSMYFFLPNAKDGLSALMEKVSSESGFLDRHLPYQEIAVGLTEMVDNSTVGRKLYVSSIFHKSFIEVNEEGTEAAAASAAIMIAQCYRREEKIDFVADHPFLFVIREDMTGAVLFIGQVLNPLVG